MSLFKTPTKSLGKDESFYRRKYEECLLEINTLRQQMMACDEICEKKLRNAKKLETEFSQLKHHIKRLEKEIEIKRRKKRHTSLPKNTRLPLRTQKKSPKRKLSNSHIHDTLKKFQKTQVFSEEYYVDLISKLENLNENLKLKYLTANSEKVHLHNHCKSVDKLHKSQVNGLRKELKKIYKIQGTLQKELRALKKTSSETFSSNAHLRKDNRRLKLENLHLKQKIKDYEYAFNTTIRSKLIHFDEYSFERIEDISTLGNTIAHSPTKAEVKKNTKNVKKPKNYKKGKRKGKSDEVLKRLGVANVYEEEMKLKKKKKKKKSGSKGNTSSGSTKKKQSSKKKIFFSKKYSQVEVSDEGDGNEGEGDSDELHIKRNNFVFEKKEEEREEEFLQNANQ